MARVKGALSTRKRRKKILKAAKGYWGSKSKHFKMAKQAVLKSGNYAFIGRKQKKRDFRALWITRISAACKMNGINYSRFMYGLKKSGIVLNRKMLSELADALKARELIKITVLPNSGIAAKELIRQLATDLNAEPVRAIGRKIILYKRPDDPSKAKIKL